MSTKKTVAGIDFGTSNSGIGYDNDGKPELVFLDGNKQIIPTALFFDDAFHMVTPDAASYGFRAVHDYQRGLKGRFMSGLKSLLGTSSMTEGTHIHNQLISFEFLIGCFINHLKQKAEKQANAEISSVVVGRPVHFSDDPKEDKLAETSLRKILTDQGFKDVELQYEPIAAALDFESRINKETLVFVADIGGGTSDFSVIKLSPKRAISANRQNDILSNDSVHIAGNDLDVEINYQKVMPYFGKNDKQKNGLPIPVYLFSQLSRWEQITRLYEPEVLLEVKDLLRYTQNPENLKRFVKILENKMAHHLSFAAEQAKKDLTETSWTEIDLFDVDELDILFQRDEFEKIVERQTSQIIKKADSVIKNSGVDRKKIDALLLTGGTSYVPIIRNGLSQLCPNATLEDSNRFSSVTNGLVIEAMRRFKEKSRN